MCNKRFSTIVSLKSIAMKQTFILVILFLSINAFAQNDAVINDPNVQKRTLNGSFSAISVSDGIQLYLTQGDEESIAISASEEKYLQRYKTEVTNGTLKIYYDNNGMSWSGDEHRKLKAYVSFKTLQKLKASGGAHVTMKSVLKSENLEVSFSSGSRFDGEVDVTKMDASSSSGADINITGKSGSLKVDVSSGAIFKGYELVVDFCDAEASSGGGVRVNVNKELVVKASSGGGVRYKGAGVIRDMDISSGGNVKKG